MSKQLALSAAISIFAMAAIALGAPAMADQQVAAAKHGSSSAAAVAIAN